MIFQLGPATKTRGVAVGEVVDQVKLAEISQVISTNPTILTFWDKISGGKPPTLENVAIASQSNPEFKAVLESELQKAGLLQYWQQFVAEYNRRQAFDTAKMAGEVRQAARNVTSAVQKDHDYAQDAEKRLNRLVRPKKASPAEFQPKNAA